MDTSTASRSKQTHAAHNKELCDLLYDNYSPKYDDWVITTAFYSCIHHLEDYIFPLNVNGTNYVSIADYMLKRNLKCSLHEARRQLIITHTPVSISKKFTELQRDCHDARYKDYIVADYIARRAHNTMGIILSLRKT